MKSRNNICPECNKPIASKSGRAKRHVRCSYIKALRVAVAFNKTLQTKKHKRSAIMSREHITAMYRY
ncbi:MAG: hypothetical protein IMZ53_12705 [Thermoplasmata archaeon]|nr:hypothetical protein [Thermoplasmata archaeon]